MGSREGGKPDAGLFEGVATAGLRAGGLIAAGVGEIGQVRLSTPAGTGSGAVQVSRFYQLSDGSFRGVCGLPITDSVAPEPDGAT